MKTRELFEMASLDVLGLLDVQERSAFEAAFRAAPPEVQAQIRREQRRFADIERSLPEVQAPAGLRARVVAAVREAMASVRTEPVGRIGFGVSGFGFNSTPIWRAACIGFATASLVLAGFGYKVTQDMRAIQGDLTADSVSRSVVSAAGPDFLRMLGSSQVRNVAFTPARAAPDATPTRAQGRIYIDVQSSRAYLFFNDLEAINGEYTVVVNPGNGRAPFKLQGFTATPGLSIVTIKEKVEIDQIDQLQIHRPGRAPGETEVVLQASRV